MLIDIRFSVSHVCSGNLTIIQTIKGLEDMTEQNTSNVRK